MATDYSKLKVAELKDLLKDRGIAQTGLNLKQQYIEALEAQDGENNGEGGIDGAGDEAGTADASGEAADTGATETATAEDVDVKDAVEDREVTSADEAVKDELDISNKRKRSAAPEESEEVVSKKLKSAEEESANAVDVKLPEDVVSEAPAPLDTESSSQEKVLPYGSSDDVQALNGGTSEPAEEKAHADSSDPTEISTVDPDAQSAPPLERKTPMDLEDATGPTSQHPRTRALYIRDLLRPLQPNALREHLETIAKTAVEDFHLDKIRTHAFVLFDSINSASKVRATLHSNKWPEEAMRKPLWVDYIPEDKVREWIDLEVNRGDSTRWEVVYESTGLDTDSGVTASLQEVDARPSAGRQPSTTNVATRAPSGAGEGMPNAPSGPRQRSTQTQPQRPAPPPQRAAENRTFDSLDQRFSSTETKPKLYYQPVPGDLAQRRLDDLAAATSRDWNDRDADPSAYAEGELYRYTFEDGDRLVDGGADFGLFGRRGRGGGFGPRGSGPRGGRGGRGRGGDSYRGDSYRGRRPY